MLFRSGRGINVNKVKEKSVEKNIITESEAAKISNEEVYQLLFRSGFSTRDEVSDLSGRGVGLDAVKVEVEKLKGKVWLESNLGKGTRLIAQVPKIEISSSNLSLNKKAA